MLLPTPNPLLGGEYAALADEQIPLLGGVRGG